MILVIVAITVMYTIMMIIHVSVAELLVFEIQSKHRTLHSHQTTEPFKRSFTDSWSESCYSRQFRANNYAHKRSLYIFKEFFSAEGREGIQSLNNKYVNETRDFDKSDTPSGGL